MTSLEIIPQNVDGSVAPLRVLVACKHGNGSERNKHGRCLCADCKAEAYQRRVAWSKRNPDRVRAYSKKWTAANREQRRAIEYSWRARNPDKVKAMGARAGAAWSKKNSGKRNAMTMKRVAAKRQRTPQWADLQAIEAFYVEAARLSRETGVPHEVDHIVPLQGAEVSGLHVEYNLQIITRTENRSKHNRMVPA